MSIARGQIIKDFEEFMNSLDEDHMEFHSKHSCAWDVWEAAAKLYIPRWVYDRMPERDGLYRCKLHRQIPDDPYEEPDDHSETVEEYCKEEGGWQLYSNERLICWLQHPEPIDEGNTKGE